MADWQSTVTPPALARLLAGAPPTEERTAYRRLAAQLRSLVSAGRLPVGTRLPAERELAQALTLSRTTVATAYESLRSEGYLRSRRGSGSWTALPEGSRPPGDALHPVPPHESGHLVDLGVASLPAPQPYLGEAAARAVEQLPAYATGHGQYPTGVPVLREAIARRFTERGLPTTPDQILVTTGAMSALHLFQRTLLNRGDRVAVEAPGYAHTLGLLQREGARLVPVPLARPGGDTALPRWDTEEWSRVLRGAAPRAAFVVPDFHNPTGALIEEEQRRTLLAAARTSGTVVVVDETPAELDWGTDRMPLPTAALDRAAQTVTVGSASKILWGGLRIGWLRAQPALIRRLAAERVYTDVGTPVLDQLIAAHLLDHALPEVRAHQHARMRDTAHALAAALRTQLPTWQFALPRGGLCLWVATDGHSTTALAETADPQGLRLAPGPSFATDGTLEPYLRLPLTIPADQVEDAVTRLRTVTMGARGTARATRGALT
ncbi:GntR family transcriptional regulator [Kitasatospora sp. MMS16-BH015]|uniref:MocR-like transcription factor YczR n=1 Tax=Kitasatospora sp. MMS16-BH015 TaxID=2018025 RepID=UPI000CA28362|nr:PLP-dependent aminotransferase family protein [Kitasatospora sp. MMS16-BH015]AUG80359.1 GntR family transcriptional regulator [Kitasatospora sp. MMS16-BH015]